MTKTKQMKTQTKISTKSGELDPNMISPFHC